MKLSVNTLLLSLSTKSISANWANAALGNIELVNQHFSEVEERAKCKNTPTPATCQDCQNVKKCVKKAGFKTLCENLGWNKKTGCSGDGGGGDDDCPIPTVCEDCEAIKNNKSCKKQHKNLCKSLNWNKKKGCGDGGDGGDDSCTTPTTCSDCLSFPDKKCKKQHKTTCQNLGWDKKTGCDNTDDETCDETGDTSSGSSSATCSDSSCTITFADGSTFVGNREGDYVEFLGVPYAQAPIGARRWKTPELRNDFCGNSYDFTSDAPGCAPNPFNGSNQDQSEDCLTVNIYTDAEIMQEGGAIPIVYFVHGGAFNFGNNNVNARNLVRKQGVMVISIAYRLGIRGFLWSPTKEDGESNQGNWGLLDQRAAMEWSQTWAPHFGGDISQSTLTGCSAGSEGNWWHLTMEDSWPYFQRVVAVGVGLNSAYDATIAEDLFNAAMSNAGCSDLDCMRGKTDAEISAAANAATDQVKHPIKLSLEPGFGPVVDGDLLPNQLIDAVGQGLIRPNTPISWNFAKDDSWAMGEGDYQNLKKVPALEALSEEMDSVGSANGVGCPSPYFNTWLEEVYGVDSSSPVVTQFGCEDPSTNINCKEQFTSFTMMATWVCNTKQALESAFQVSTDLGPIYPVQFAVPTCDLESGTPRTCHCAETAFIWDNVNAATHPSGAEYETSINDFADAYGQFFRAGTFPAGTFMSYEDITLSGGDWINSVGTEFTQTSIGDTECPILDALDTYLWEPM